MPHSNPPGNPQGNNPQGTDQANLIGDLYNEPVIFNPPAQDPANPQPPTPPATNDQQNGQGGDDGLPTNPGTPPATDPTPPPVGTNDVVSIFSKEDNSLTDNERDIKSGIIDIFKGEKLDTEGNLINASGEVVLSATQLSDFIEKDILPLDEKGNQINAKGDIIKSAEAILLENSIVLGTKARLESSLGITYPEDYQLDDTEEGIVKLVEDSIKIANKGSVVSFLNGNPLIKQFYQHLALGNEPDKFISGVVDYSNVKVADLDNQGNLNLIKEAYKKQGVHNADTLVNLLKQGGEDLVKQEGKNALSYLKTKQEEETADRDAQIAARRKTEEKELVDYWNGVKQKVTAGNLGNIVIPQQERDAFFKYMSAPIDSQGNSKESKDIEGEQVDFQLMVSYLRYKKYDISKLATIISKEERVKTLRERVARNKPTPNSAPAKYNGKGNPNSAPSIDNLYN